MADVPEPHWPGLAAVAAAASLSFFMPESLSPIPGGTLVIAVAVLAASGELLPAWHRALGHAANAVVTIQLATALAGLIRDITAHSGKPVALLQGALLVWSMNVLVFAAWYWRLDAGGPHRRSRHSVYCGGAFLFPQLTMSGELRKATGANGWRPRFVDYLFLAFNASTAFSPTDAPVLSRWAKILMMIQSSISLTAIAMVAARAVNIL